eukprot:1050114-Karenia_brevis.AAC.1
MVMMMMPILMRVTLMSMIIMVIVMIFMMVSHDGDYNSGDIHDIGDLGGAPWIMDEGDDGDAAMRTITILIMK